MSWTRIEIEYTCPLCDNVHILSTSVIVYNIGDDVPKISEHQHCTKCNVSFGISEGMDISKLTIPVRDNFGASIF